MSALAHETQNNFEANRMQEIAAHHSCHAVLELTVKNHPGVMSHICGLFARRAYNVEGIICLPTDGGAVSKMWLLVYKDERFNQIMKQVMKLEDVVDVRNRGAEPEVFERLKEFFQSGIVSESR